MPHSPAEAMYVVSMGVSKPWNTDETRALLAAYFEMLQLETRGEAYSKMAYNRQVQAATGRSKGSIEFKFCNVSHILSEAGVPYVDGYKPRSHVQEALREAVLNAIKPRANCDHEGDVPAGTAGRVLSSSSIPSTAVRHATALTERGLLSAPTAAEMEHANSWERLIGLWDRATGGTDVAARPDHPVDTAWPSALRPAGVEEACEWLREGVAGGKPARFLFLVGGPGAGKSHATAHVVQGLQLVSELEEGLAHRIYDYQGPVSDLVVVNDATINLETANRAPLISDITHVAVGVNDDLPVRPRHLMACVNRGVLVEEMADSRRRTSDTWSAGDVLVRWLYGSQPANPNQSTWQISDVAGQDFIRSARLSNEGDHVANILAVFVDECSLFEERPTVTIGADHRVSADEYRIVPLTERRAMEEGLAPAADLLVNVLKAVDDPEGSLSSTRADAEVDPLAANLQSLRSPLVRSGLLTIARSAELVSGTRMTYRELWGFLTRALVGDAPSRMPRERLGDFVMENQPAGLSAEDDFERLRRLSALRFSQGIFGAGAHSAAQDGALRDPVLRLLIPVDPVRDAVPGDNPDEPDEGWATPVSDAFGVHASDGTPLQSLLSSVREDSLLRAVMTDFDKRLDETFALLMQSRELKDERRLEATAWYGAYLTRLYAVSQGICAFRREVAMLIRTWVQSPYLPDDLKSPLRTLLRPKRNPLESSSSLLPLFDSRTEPITGRVSRPKLAVRVREPELSTDRQKQGEQILLVIGAEGTTMSTVSLDFPLIREALACVDDHIGVTDLIDVTAPRLERVRASRLLPTHLNAAEFCLADGDREVQITKRHVKES